MICRLIRQSFTPHKTNALSNHYWHGLTPQTVGSALGVGFIRDHNKPSHLLSVRSWGRSTPFHGGPDEGRNRRVPQSVIINRILKVTWTTDIQGERKSVAELLDYYSTERRLLSTASSLHQSSQNVDEREGERERERERERREVGTREKRETSRETS